MDCASIVNSVGLVIDIVGAIMLWKYGLPESIDREGYEPVVVGEQDQSEVNKAKKYDCFSKIGLSMLIGGFFLQLISNFIKGT